MRWAVKAQMFRGLKFRIEKEGLYYTCTEKTNVLISSMVIMNLVCLFVFVYANSRLSHDVAHI